MYTVASLAKFLKTSDEAILAHIKSGRLRATNIGSGAIRPRYRISESQLDEFLTARSTSKPTSTRRRKGASPVQYV